MFGVLISLLLRPHPRLFTLAGPSERDKLELKWSDLCVKCLIKITKGLPATIEVGGLA